MGLDDLRKEAREFREEFRDFRHKLREAKKGGLTQEERAALKPELLEVLQEGAELLGASVVVVKDVIDFLEERL